MQVDFVVNAEHFPTPSLLQGPALLCCCQFHTQGCTVLCPNGKSAANSCAAVLLPVVHLGLHCARMVAH
jgi:hypothetical protein